MAKYSEVVALLEWADKKANTKPPKSKSRGFKQKEFDPIEYVRKEKEKVERWEKFLKDQEKINKKEEKKPESKDMTRLFFGLEWFIIGILSYPIVGPAYQAMMHVGK